jgi:hypothetical protein
MNGPKLIKNYIQVDDHFFTIKRENDGRPYIVSSTEEEIAESEFEKICLNDGEAADVSMFQTIIDNAQVELKRNLETGLKSLVLDAMGVSQGSDNRMWVKSHEKSSVVNILKDKIEKRLKEVDLDRDLDLTDLEKKTLRAAMKKYFKDTYEQSVRSLVWKMAENEAKKHVDEFLGEVGRNKMKQVAKEMVDRAIKKY